MKASQLILTVANVTATCINIFHFFSERRNKFSECLVWMLTRLREKHTWPTLYDILISRYGLAPLLQSKCTELFHIYFINQEAKIIKLRINHVCSTNSAGQIS